MLPGQMELPLNHVTDVSVLKGKFWYLGTPYTKYRAGIDRAYSDAANVEGQLLKAGVRGYSPIVEGHSVAIHGFVDPLDYSIWIPFNEEMIRRTDGLVVVMMEGWAVSTGLRAEIESFTSQGKPVLYIDPYAHGWLKPMQVAA